MIVCSCNALTHHDVEHAVEGGASRPAEIYAARGCRAECGNCVPGVVCMLREIRDARRAVMAAARRAVMTTEAAACH
ncbi:(2Fe-2S)-binding protein [Acidomonas methanolica]|uniref:(2Fe-2S)-binding protein n=1 Tax=Acidomonas methanolica TaxID=437 RepID=UPI0010E42E02|nr:(2Fe-2S)-binding protein [Acidomonas methanolica]MBU2654398.1 (2Fe-2S)-binding protein [Acidomonas methanolica]MCQ9156450.1 (2Fe-2S)-binding protein [Acidomonas methanolica]TCS28487.1 BFD-like [2Fe-2S] binding protein [Acidomonas methanolica]